MPNMTDYLLWRGDVTFREKELNEVDSLILCTLCYLPWEDLVPSTDSAEGLPFITAAGKFVSSGRAPLGAIDPRPLLRPCALSARFSSALAGDFVNRVNRQNGMQFCAMTFRLDDGSLFAAFRGTDSTLTGWREDFSLSYSETTPAQEAAVRYLELIAAKYPGPISLGGHSKGGNLALYAASFCRGSVRARIGAVYSCDGPGLNEKTVCLPGFVPLGDRLRLIIPEESVVGVMMNDGEERKVVKSSAKGFQQHDPMTWQVLGPSFEEAGGQTGNSVFVDRTFRRWLGDMSEQEREGLTTLLFDGMEATGANTMGEAKAQGLNAAGAMVKNFIAMDGSRQKDVLEAVGKLLRAGGGQLADGARKGVDGLMGIIGLNNNPGADRKKPGDPPPDGNKT